MTALFLDSNVLLHAAGGPHAHREPSRRVLAAVGAGDVQLHLSVEAIQEFVHHRMRRCSTAEAVAAARALRESSILHAFDDDVLGQALSLIELTTIRGRDAVHAATALKAGFTSIVTTDSDFASVPGLRPITPESALAP